MSEKPEIDEKYEAPKKAPKKASIELDIDANVFQTLKEEEINAIKAEKTKEQLRHERNKALVFSRYELGERSATKIGDEIGMTFVGVLRYAEELKLEGMTR